MDPFAPVPPPSAAAVKSAKDLRAKLEETFVDFTKDFDNRYEAWKKTWFSGNNSTSPDAETRASGPEFAAVVALGPKIVPLVVDRLTSGKDFMAVVLCMAVSITPEPKTIHTQTADIANR